MGAMVMRLALLASIAWVVKLTNPLFTVLGQEISFRDLILLLGGLFLIWKASKEIHESIEGEEEGLKTNVHSFLGAIVQIMLLDIIFSLDSVITAVGLSDHLFIMMAAVVIAVGVMMFAARPIGDFVDRHPSVKMLALSFLILVGFTLMLEVPSMVFMLPQLASRIDFISVGTNDLTQYLLAVDRNNTRVASMYDSLHPAVLRALAMITHDAERFGIDLRLCGEMAGDPMCVTILVGLGYRHLSMNGRSVARVKYLLRRIDIEEAQELSRRSLEAQMTAEVRHQVAAFMERRGLGGLIRGGR